MRGTAQRTGPLTLRKGSSDDLDSVIEIMTDAFDPKFGEAWTRSQCAGILPMTGVRLTLAEDGNTPVGFSLHRTIIDEAELLLLAVARQVQRRGIGGLLLQAFLEDAASSGAQKVHLEVRQNNVALEMYKTAGFNLVGRRPDYYQGISGDRFDALTFARHVQVPAEDGI